MTTPDDRTYWSPDIFDQVLDDNGMRGDTVRPPDDDEGDEEEEEEEEADE